MVTGLFRTRLAPDLRVAIGMNLDVQTTSSTATANWFTNRAADTRFAVALPDEDFPEGIPILDGGCSLAHLALIEDLKPSTEYKYRVTSRLTDVDELIAQGLMTEGEVTFTRTDVLRTKKESVPLRFLSPPQRVISADGAILNFRLNQVAGALLDYGLMLSLIHI